VEVEALGQPLNYKEQNVRTENFSRFNIAAAKLMSADTEEWTMPKIRYAAVVRIKHSSSSSQKGD
jgi:hypothetical protein